MTPGGPRGRPMDPRDSQSALSLESRGPIGPRTASQKLSRRPPWSILGPKRSQHGSPKLSRRSFGSILGLKMAPKDLRKHQRPKVEGPRSNLQGSRPKLEGPKSVATKVGARVRRDSRSVNSYTHPSGANMAPNNIIHTRLGPESATGPKWHQTNYYTLLYIIIHYYTL